MELEDARLQQARLKDLRAAAGLARSWYGHGRRQEACELAVPIRARFTEGHDRVDPIDAGRLLQPLRRWRVTRRQTS